MSVLNQSGEEQVECPLCMEPLEVDDLNFFPCTCGYQICRFCWHRIRTDENGLCPACRKAYPENPADFKPLSQEEVARLKAEKRHKDQQRKQKITENRKHLANVRVVQRNLVFVVGLPMRLADAEVLKKHEYFGKFGKILKVVINQSTSYAGSQGPSASAYVTYHKADDALHAIQAVNNISVDGRTIKTSLGTTKYCSHFMKNQTCPKPDCMYLHELGDTEASFTKEEMQQGKHQEYEKKLHEQLLNTYNQNCASRDRKPTPSPPAVSSTIANCQNVYQGNSSSSTYSGTNSNSTSCIQSSQSCNKEAWPSLQPGITSSNNNGNSFGISLGGNSNTSSNNSNNTNNNLNSSNNNSKHENARRQRFDQQIPKVTANNHKKRHTSGDENRGKGKEKLQSTLQDEAGTKIHSKSNSSQHSNSRSQKDLFFSSHDLPTNLQNPTRSSNNSSSSSSSEITNGPSTEGDSDLHMCDETLGSVGNSTVNGIQQFSGQNGGRILQATHRATLFEPDNNSFFSTNNFMKVSTTSTGSAPTEWPINGLALTHMPDVLPPVHSSEDWQAAFGFSNSTNSHFQENDCIIVASDNQEIQEDSSGLTSKIDSDIGDNEFDSSDQESSQNFKTNCEDNSPLLESVSPNFPIPTTPNHNEEYRLGNSENGHLQQAIHVSVGNSFVPEEISVTANIVTNSLPSLQSPISSSSGGVSQQIFQHMSSFVHQDGRFLMMHHPHQFPINSNLVNHIAGSQHLIANGLPPSQATSKFLADFNLRQQTQTLMKQLNPQVQPYSHLHNHSVVVDSASFGGRSAGNLPNMPSIGGKFNILGASDYNTVMGKCIGECSVNSEKLQNGGNIIENDLNISDDEKYIPGFLDLQQNSLDTNIELNQTVNSHNLIVPSLENGEETITKDNGRTADDELGFDPFHETQKALAEMMEKENMMLMMQDQPNKHHTSHNLLNRHAGVNNLTHHAYQQYHLDQMNLYNHQVPHSSAFGGSKLLGFCTSCNQQHVLPQQNHRLPPNVTGCTKLLDGLGFGPSHIAPVGPSPPTRTRLPPPGFTTAPNHMNAFGLGIPRAPSNNSSKILPFMRLGNNPNSSNNGSSPISQNNIPNTITSSTSLNSQQGTSQPIIFPTNNHNPSNNHTFGLQNGNLVNNSVLNPSGESFIVKDWPENLRSLLPNVNTGPHSHALQFLETSTPPPSNSVSLNTVFGAHHSSVYDDNSQKGWNGVEPCTDWTALDPAIVSSSHPHNFVTTTSSSLSSSSSSSSSSLSSSSSSSAASHPSLNLPSNPGQHMLHNVSPLLQNETPSEQQNTNSLTAEGLPHLHQLQQTNTNHWMRSLPSEENGCVFYGSNVDSNSSDWTAGNQQQQNHVIGSPNSGSVMMAPPPPGFPSMRIAPMQQVNSIQKKINSVLNTEMGDTENAIQSEEGITQTKEEDRMEDLR